MAKNEGKKFEEDFKTSCEKVENLFCYRFKDGSSAWGGNDKTRFQATNICDMEVFYQTKLVLLELKSTLGASLPYGNIKDHQITDMSKALDTKAENIFVGFLINFRDYAETFYMSIEQFNTYKNNTERKSIPIEFCRKNCIQVKQEQKRVRYSYDIKEFINKL